MRVALAFVLVGCASAEQPTGLGSKPAAPIASASGSASASPSASASASAPDNHAGVEGECRASKRRDCFTSPDGFRAIHPFPLARTYRDVAVLPNGEVWIVGDDATLLRIVRNDKGEAELSKITIPKIPSFAETVRKIDGRSYDPNAWPGAELMLSDFEAISALGANNVWIAVGGGHAAFWGGTSWHLEELPSLGGAGDALMRDRDGNVWMSGAVGAGLFSKAQRPRIYETSGGKIDSSEGPKIPTNKRIRAIARQGTDVWAAGYDGALFVSRKGAQFVPIPVPGDARENFNDLWLDADGTSGFLLGDKVYRKIGDRFEDPIPVPDLVYDIWSAPGGRSVWAVGLSAFKLEGGKFTNVPAEGIRATDRAFELVAHRFEGIDGRASDDVWMAGAYGGIYHYDGKTLKALHPRETDREVVGLEWTGDRTFVAATWDGKLLNGSLDKDTLTVERSPLEDISALRKLLSGDLVAASCGEVELRTKAGWSKLPKPPGCVKKVGGLGPDDLWAIGSDDLVDGFVWRFKKGTWSRVKTGSEKELYDVVVASDGTAWIGGDGILFRSSGDVLRMVATHEYDEYRALAVKAADDVWIAGDSNEIGSAGLVLHWNGKKLERFERVAGNFLDSIAVGPGGELWALGLGGVGTRYDGKTFTPLATGTDLKLSGVLRHPSGVLLAWGDGGAILRRDPPKAD